MNKTSKPSRTQNRELTALEYTILGFLGIQPQSGYDIIMLFEVGTYRASASAGSIYPVLKRLEALNLITSTLETVHETRPRKVYSLLPAGGQVLDEWLRREPSMAEVLEEYDIAMRKFLAAEARLSRVEVLEWLNAYERVAASALALRESFSRATDNEEALSAHTRLINRWLVLEIEARLHWIREARSRLTGTPQETA